MATIISTRAEPLVRPPTLVVLLLAGIAIGLSIGLVVTGSGASMTAESVTLADGANAVAESVSGDGDASAASVEAAFSLASDDPRVAQNETAVSEPPYREPVPEPGDEYFEAEDPDGEWVSYVNPRDEYRNPYLGSGSGKICVTLLNEAGEPVVGESVPNTTVTVPTGESLAWHGHADPFTVQFPLTAHYERPLDADQFGTSDELVQGDGYLDSHCLEWHGLSSDATVTYGDAEIEGAHADGIEVVGYLQQAHAAWDSDVDPLVDAESYEAAGGGWTYQTEASHGQVVVVLQLTGEGLNVTGEDGTGDDAGDDSPGDDTVDDTGDHATDDATDEASDGDTVRADDAGDESDGTVGDGTDDATDGPDADGMADDAADEVPGFGALIGALAIGFAMLLWRVREKEAW